LRASTENRIDKLQIARRELDFAILTQCRREESLAVHLLAFSAYTILFDLWKERHGDNALKFALERFLDRREKLGAEFHDIPNSMKHADRKPDGWLEDHSPKSAYLTLALATILWSALGETETARSGLEALMARADELHVEPGPRTYAEMARITALRST